ncbi:hypothetical protein PMAYCL1PPCAC_11116, partial [Pristionchus mayeri]
TTCIFSRNTQLRMATDDGYSSTTTFDEILNKMEVLRPIVSHLNLRDRYSAMQANRAMRIAVATSKYEINYIDVTASANSTHISVFIDKKIISGEPRDVFNKLDSFFEKATFKKLSMIDVDLDETTKKLLLRKQNSFENVTIKRDTARPLTQGTVDIIKKAKGDVVIEMRANNLTEDEMLSIPRRVTFNLDQRAFLQGDVFTTLVLNGHSLQKIETDISTFENLDKIIEAVSDTPERQNIEFWNRDCQVCKRYVEFVQAQLEYPMYSHENSDEQYRHLRATIYIWGTDVPTRAKIEVDSYPEEDRIRDERDFMNVMKASLEKEGLNPEHYHEFEE